MAAYFAEWGVPALAGRELPPVRSEARAGERRELCPPAATGEVAAYFAEWGVPAAEAPPVQTLAKFGQLEVVLARQELAPQAPTGDMATLFAEWGVGPLLASESSSSPGLTSPGRMEPRVQGMRRELRPARAECQPATALASSLAHFQAECAAAVG